MRDHTGLESFQLLKNFYLLLVIILGLLIMIGCSNSENMKGIQLEESKIVSLHVANVSADANQQFSNDPGLQQLITDESLMIPDRFEIVSRADREPILSLGLIESAARLTMFSVVTREIITLDLLRLEQDIDDEEFFTAFADSMTDNSIFRDIRMVGVRRGIGEYARHYVFTIEDDEAESAVFLRHNIIALIGYRAPIGLRYPIAIGDLMRRLDGSIKTDYLIKTGIDPRSD